MTALDDAKKALLSQHTISVSQARLVLGVSDAVARRAIEEGEIESLRLGRNIRVLSEPLKKKLGLS